MIQRKFLCELTWQVARVYRETSISGSPDSLAKARPVCRMAKKSRIGNILQGRRIFYLDERAKPFALSLYLSQFEALKY
jgi:hypothetical protein